MAMEGIRTVKNFTPDQLWSQLASSTHGHIESVTSAVSRDGCVYRASCSGEGPCSSVNMSIDCDVSESSQPTAVVVVKATAMGVVMVTAVLGNLLVIASVLHDRRLRNRANSFIVSMAFADLLVAILVMPFSAIQEVYGRWLFGTVTCNLFNANDVLFSTASLLHLCCISVDRYVAVTDPFRYGSKMTRRRAAAMLVGIWLASALLSHVPIHMGWYTTVEHLQRMESLPAPTECVFVVNRVYGIVSSIVSFWTPAVVMVFAYRKIFREARRQERSIRLSSGSPQPSLESQTSRTISAESSTSLGVGAGGGGSVLLVGQDNGSNGTYSVSRRLNRHRKKIQQDHKAARTLGIIMGAFLSCWLPFFTWYLTETMCGDLCHTPPIVIFLLFWIGYMNSALNPVIYPFFNRDFRDAFRRLFRRLGCGTRGCCSGRTSPISGSSNGSSFHLVTAGRGVRSTIMSSRRKQVCFG